MLFVLVAILFTGAYGQQWGQQQFWNNQQQQNPWPQQQWRQNQRGQQHQGNQWGTNQWQPAPPTLPQPTRRPSTPTGVNPNLTRRQRLQMKCFNCTAQPLNICDADFMVRVEVVQVLNVAHPLWKGNNVYRVLLHEPMMQATVQFGQFLSQFGGPRNEEFLLFAPDTKACPGVKLRRGMNYLISGQLVPTQNTTPGAAATGTELRATITPCRFWGFYDRIAPALRSFLQKRACMNAQVIMPSQFGTDHIDPTLYNANFLP